jgi:hypothetical protein
MREQTEAIVDAIRELEEEPPGHVLTHAIDRIPHRSRRIWTGLSIT